MRVLVVEDDPIIALATVDMLETLGHRAVEAASAGEALSLLESENFAVMVTDIRLPDMQGGELAAKAVAAHPNLRIVFATGDIAEGAVDASVLAAASVLRKPYDEERLANAIAAVMRR